MHFILLYVGQKVLWFFNFLKSVVHVYFVANQQTVVELIGFFQRAFPQSASVKSSETRTIDQSEPLISEVRIFMHCFMH